MFAQAAFASSAPEKRVTNILINWIRGHFDLRHFLGYHFASGALVATSRFEYLALFENRLIVLKERLQTTKVTKRRLQTTKMSIKDFFPTFLRFRVKKS